MTWILPTVWAGLEFARTLGPIGFPFGALGLPFYQHLWFIQIADLGGLFMVSFVVATISGFVLDMILRATASDLKGLKGLTRTWLLPRLGFLVTLWIMVGGYGVFRLNQVRSELRPGPVVTVVQPDVPYGNQHRSGYDGNRLLRELQELSTNGITNKARPDLLVWPEVIDALSLRNPEYFEAEFDSRMVPRSALTTTSQDDLRRQWDSHRRHEGARADQVQQWVNEVKIPLLLGLKVALPSVDKTRPFFREFNGAQVLHPNEHSRGAKNRQLKVKLFPLGEFLPGRHSSLGGWLAGLPVVGEWTEQIQDLEHGTQREVLSLFTRSEFESEIEWRFCVSICGEILFAKSAGIFDSQQDGKKRMHFLATIANEGVLKRGRGLWFTHASMTFRAIEGRLAIARSANTGISCFVDPTGRIYSYVSNSYGLAWTGRGMPEADSIDSLLTFRREHEQSFLKNDALHNELNLRLAKIDKLRKEAGIVGASTERLLLCDRTTTYQKFGDWFGYLTMSLSAILFAIGMITK
jgi:apolipoprotein N-acyltransferase